MLNFVTIIPTYNNPLTLKDVVEGVKPFCSDIIVVDDGSDPEGADVAENLEGVLLIRHNKNIGKGPALGSGLIRAKELGYTHAITIDGQCHRGD